jgi:hypothetical protein
MSLILSDVAKQLQELKQYKQRFGPLRESQQPRSRVVEEEDDDEGSDTEQE